MAMMVKTVCPDCKRVPYASEHRFDSNGDALVPCGQCANSYTASFTPRKPAEEPTLFDVPAQVAGKGHGDS